MEFALMHRPHSEVIVALADVVDDVMDAVAECVAYALEHPDQATYEPKLVNGQPWPGSWYGSTVRVQHGHGQLTGMLVISLTLEAMTEVEVIAPASYMPQMLVLVTASEAVTTVTPPVLQRDQIFMIVAM